jgi:hypothetical protein
MQLQGYVARREQQGKWRTMPEGELVPGSKPPRFARESVDRALSLGERVKDANNDPTALYKITDAVVFGDFLD